MKMPNPVVFVAAIAVVLQGLIVEVDGATSNSTSDHAHHHKAVHHKKHHDGAHHSKHHHHHHGHHHHGKHADKPAEKHEDKTKVAKPAAVPKAAVPKAAPKVPVAAVATSKDDKLVAKMKALELRLAAKKKARDEPTADGHLLVSGPVPKDFAKRFAEGVSKAMHIDAKKVIVTKTSAVKDQPGVVAVDFQSTPKVVKGVESEATDPDSKLARGSLHSFLVAKEDDEEGSADAKEEKAEPKEEAKEEAAPSEEVTPVQEKGIDIDTQMPYGDLEPFGREDTAQELTESSVKESDEMVDQLERAEVAEEKRAVFRALTRLRGAAITSFDGVARSQTGNIDEYNKVHKWRNAHPLHHLADEESDISKWAFPDNADF